MIFAIESLRDCWDEMVALAERHWNETQNFRKDEGFNPSRERYQQQEDWGSFVQFTARKNGVMVGYAGLYIVPSMHSQKLICCEDTWYLAPEERRGLAAIRFFKFMENECHRRGVWSVTLTAPTSTGAEKIHRFLGYTTVGTVSHKRLAP